MALFNTDLLSHNLRTALHRTRYNGFVIAVVSGLGIGFAVLGYSLTRPSNSDVTSLERTLKQQAITEATIIKLREQKARQDQDLAAMVDSKKRRPIAENKNVFAGEDVGYWNKQLFAFSQLTGMQLRITNTAPSRFKDAFQIKVDVSGRTPLDVVKALDFLQLYGYVESFDGSSAIVHISSI